jgi:methylated-DNA-[protein]-cysteine S-methyltransferase
MTFYTTMDSPLGPALLISDGAALTGLRLSVPMPEPGWTESPDIAPFPEVRKELAEYFRGERTTFDIPLAPEGTPFERAVWDELVKLPYGLTISYGELARRLSLGGGHARKVGQANGRNPIWLVIPCHRVVGADGKLVGYAGGIARKSALLDFEAAVIATGPQPFTTL